METFMLNKVEDVELIIERTPLSKGIYFNPEPLTSPTIFLVSKTLVSTSNIDLKRFDFQ